MGWEGASDLDLFRSTPSELTDFWSWERDLRYRVGMICLHEKIEGKSVGGISFQGAIP